MLTKTTIAVAAIAAIGSASAASQLERSLGVEPGVHTTAQLVQLSSAIADGDRDRVDFILSSARKRISTRGAPTIAAGELSAAERQVIRSALEDNEFGRAAFVRDGGLGGASADTSFLKARLAQPLGVDADAYTLSRLIKLADERQD